MDTVVVSFLASMKEKESFYEGIPCVIYMEVKIEG